MTESEKKDVQVFRRNRGKLETEMKPIVLNYRDRKKQAKAPVAGDEPEYSDGLGEIQHLERDIVRLTRRSARAISKGLDSYEKERDQSASDKKDGAIEDFAHNSAKGISTFMKEASEIPVDVAESLNRRSYRKALRRQLRRASKMIRLFRF